MAKQVKKIKVKKARKPRQPRRAGVPRKPPVTNISVTIGGQQPSGSYYFPNAAESQSVQPLIMPPVQTRARSRVLEEPALQPFDIIPPPRPEVFEIATQTAPVIRMNTGSQIQPRLRVVADTGSQTASVIRMNTGSQTQPRLGVVADTGSQTQDDIVEINEEPMAGGAARRGRPLTTEIRVYNPNNKSLGQIQATAQSLGISVVNEAGKNYTKKQLAKMINQERI